MFTLDRIIISLFMLACVLWIAQPLITLNP